MRDRFGIWHLAFALVFVVLATLNSAGYRYGASDQALYIPAGQPHSVKFTGTDKAEMVQIYAPAGPEDRYKDRDKDAKAKR